MSRQIEKQIRPRRCECVEGTGVANVWVGAGFDRNKEDKLRSHTGRLARLKSRQVHQLKPAATAQILTTENARSTPYGTLDAANSSSTETFRGHQNARNNVAVKTYQRACGLVLDILHSSLRAEIS